jgi:uncharacterized tellurite resistance protein B-like protein
LIAAPHSLLPAPLRELFPCPELDDLRTWASEVIDAGGLVPVADVIERVEGIRPDRLRKRRLVGVADALAPLSIGIAPDPRFALRAPRFDEPVVLFRVPDDREAPTDASAGYLGELLHLALGVFVTHADGPVSEVERSHLADHIESARGLSRTERVRLRANLDWMIALPPDLGLLRSHLKGVPADLRGRLARIALAIAGADGVIDPAEVRAIERLYAALELEVVDAYRDLNGLVASAEPVTVFRPVRAETEYAIPAAPSEPEPVGPDSGPQTGRIVLDRSRISAIIDETSQVASVLHDIFGMDDEDEQAAEAAGESRAPVFPGLDAAHGDLVAILLARSVRSLREFESCAEELGLMPAGALETVNEWAFDRFGEALLEEDVDFELNAYVASMLERLPASGVGIAVSGRGVVAAPEGGGWKS